METVRWGLLSTANINRRVIPAIRRSKRGKLVAVASRDLDRSKTYAAQWDIPKAFGSYEEMLGSGEIDAVYISLPSHLHSEWSVHALEAGLHVLCEKPFAISLQEVDRMIAAAQKADRKLAEAFMYRHNPQTRLIGEWVHSGRLGEIILVRAAFSFRLDPEQEYNVRLFPPDQGGGSLWDIGVYPISLAQYIFKGLPKSVFGHMRLGPTGIDESFVGTMHYQSGGYAQIASSFRSPYYTHADILGTLGSLSATRPFGFIDEGTLTFTPNGGNSEVIEVDRQDSYLGEIEDMHAAILDGQPPIISLDETRNHIRTAVALLESARTQQTIVLE